MKKLTLALAIATMAPTLSQAKVSEATLYPNGGQLSWVESSSIEKGVGEVKISGLPVDFDNNSLQVGFSGNDDIQIQQVSVSVEELKENTSSEYVELLTQKVSLETELTLLDYQDQTINTTIKFADSIATKPGEEINVEDIVRVSKKLQDVQSEAFKRKIELKSERSEVEKELDVVNRKIQALVNAGKRQKEVTIQYVADNAMKGDWKLQFFVPSVGWQSAYNARLDTQSERLSVDHKAVIRQQSGVDWEDVDLSLSLMMPSRGVSLPEPQIWEVFREKPRPKAYSNGLMMKSADIAMMAEAAPVARFQKAEPRSTLVDSGRTQSFKINGAVSLDSQRESQVILINNHDFGVSLKTHFIPYLSTDGYVVAHASFDGEERLPAGNMTLYRDGQMVGSWHAKEIKPKEKFEIGFGVDERVSLKTITEKDERGESGIVTSENTWDRLNQYEVTNHYNQSVDVRVIDRLPVSRHEDIDVVKYNISRPLINDYDEKEGVIAWDRTIPPSGEVTLQAGFEIKVPEDQEI